MEEFFPNKKKPNSNLIDEDIGIIVPVFSTELSSYFFMVKFDIIQYSCN